MKRQVSCLPGAPPCTAQGGPAIEKSSRVRATWAGAKSWMGVSWSICFQPLHCDLELPLPALVSPVAWNFPSCCLFSAPKLSLPDRVHRA